MPIKGDKRPFADRFWEKVDVRGPDDCWVWRAFKNKDGYGAIHDGEAGVIRAHRASVILDGRDPSGKCVLHSCNNPGCVNPRHLRVGTQEENVRDAINAGTFYWFEQASGENHYSTKLTRKEVDRIRLMGAAGMGYPDIARMNGITVQAVHAYVVGIKWRSLPPLRIVSSYPSEVKRRKGSEKLTPDEVVEMKRRRRAGESIKKLARHFGISPATVSLAVRGLTWKGVGDELAIDLFPRDIGVFSRQNRRRT